MANFVALDGAGLGRPLRTFVMGMIAGVKPKSRDLNEGVAFGSVNRDPFAFAAATVVAEGG